MAEVDHQQNVEVYKQGVQSKAAASGWNFKNEQRPAGKNDIEYTAVEKAPNSSALQVRVPKGDMTLKAIFAKMAHVPEASIKRDIPGNTARMYKEIGEHEAGHTHGAGSMGGEGLHEEIHGDITAYDGSDPEMEEVVRDTRKLASLVNPSHATSPALPDVPGGKAPEVVTAKLHQAQSLFRDTVAADLMSNGHIQKMEDLKALQEKNPAVIRQSVETLQKSGAFDNLNTLESVGKYVRQYAQDYLDASQKWLDQSAAAIPQTSQPVQRAPETGPMR